MGIDSSIDKVLERRLEVETQLSRSADLSSREIAGFSRELSELRPVRYCMIDLKYHAEDARSRAINTRRLTLFRP